MRKNFVILGMVAATLLASSCASKKDLQNCQNENRELSTNYQNAKEELAAAKARAARHRLSSRRKTMQPCSARSTRVSATQAPTMSTYRSW